MFARLSDQVCFTRCAALALMLIAVQATGVSAADTTAANATREQTLVIGRVSDDPKKHFPRLMKICGYLADRLAEQGVTAADVVITSSLQDMIRHLQEGRVDLVSETPFAAVRFMEEAGSEPVLREWKKGVPTYRSILIKLTDNPIKELSDLKGRKIVFEDAGSTSAYLLPAAILMQQGLEMVLLASITDEVPKDRVGYIFAGSESSVVSAVARGLVDVGALSNLDWDEIVQAPETLKSRLEIFYESEPVLRSVILVREDMRGQLKERIKELFLAMNCISSDLI